MPSGIELLALLTGAIAWICAIRRFAFFSTTSKLDPLFHYNPEATQNLNALRALLLAAKQSASEPSRPIFQHIKLSLRPADTLELALTKPDTSKATEPQVISDSDVYSRRMLHAALSATFISSQAAKSSGQELEAPSTISSKKAR